MGWEFETSLGYTVRLSKQTNQTANQLDNQKRQKPILVSKTKKQWEKKNPGEELGAGLDLLDVTLKGGQENKAKQKHVKPHSASELLPRRLSAEQDGRARKGRRH